MNTSFDIWQTIRQEVQTAAAKEPLLASFLHLTVLQHENLAHVLAFQLSSKLFSSTMDVRALYDVFLRVLENNPEITSSVEADIAACYERDPACEYYFLPLLYFKGFQAIQSHRINHALYLSGRKTLAYFLQNRASEVFGVDIHPAARFGRGIMFDHGTGIVIGETAVLGNDISLLHGVTLGGSGKKGGDRHPKIGDGVMIGANASVLGNIHIGKCAKIGAGSVVLHDVAPQTTVVGVPAKAVGLSKNIPANMMNQMIMVDNDENKQP